jgi:maleate isomerase
MNKPKFGLIVPSSNTTMESEFWRMVSAWATVHTARMRIQDIAIHDLERMEEQTIEAALRLSDAHVDIIGYGCTSGSLFKGGDHFREIEENISAATGIPSVTTAGAVVNALDKLGLTKLSVASPYTDEINALIRSFLEEHNKTVIAIKGLNIVDNNEVGLKKPQEAFDLAKEAFGLAKEANRTDTEGVFISCTNFRTIEIIEPLEKELGVPVVSSNTATLWAMMKKIGIEKKIDGLGALYY